MPQHRRPLCRDVVRARQVFDEPVARPDEKVRLVCMPSLGQRAPPQQRLDGEETRGVLGADGKTALREVPLGFKARDRAWMNDQRRIAWPPTLEERLELG